ncbi:DASS family sodium-coupled anion symporter [Lamprobacter modestohalophilus]|uniref:SLC13 family permease n=1 Tax=Lamprobacter modestohalophilus TaxID=1064514 RepID=UPI002ADEF096|nr:DASS family sodium-coupled anion symporter [Lamprobacter modestohalophilus]MEA1050691.1 DASS family sodium-coupled anion symporter [Lamprobacter modestohalophilus]
MMHTLNLIIGLALYLGLEFATGLREQGLDRWLATWVVHRAGPGLGGAARALFWLTALLSMWISNTATAAMMLPLALGLLATLPAAPETEAEAKTETKTERNTRIYVLLGIAFAANIGGIGTLVGSPPNAIAAANTGLGFAAWLLIGVPLVILMLPLMEFALRLSLRPQLSDKVEPVGEPLRWGRAQWLMLLVFASTVLAWVFGSLIADWLQISTGYDAAVALLALIALHAFGLAPWHAIAERTDWGVLLLFGGGLTLSLVLETSGAGAWLASLLAGPFASMPVVLSLMLLVLFAMALTEVASNTASAALLIPLFIGLAPQIDSVAMAMLIALGTSCAFLLPVATPPNAIIFGSGQVPQRAMLRSGLWVSAAILPLLFALAALFALGLGDVL